MGFKGVRMHDPLLDSIEEHARLFAQEHDDMKPGEVHEALGTAVDKGLVEFDRARIYKPEVREGERAEDDPVHRTGAQEAADRVLDKLSRCCLRRWEIDD